jgi:hypothetical protein
MTRRLVGAHAANGRRQHRAGDGGLLIASWGAARVYDQGVHCIDFLPASVVRADGKRHLGRTSTEVDESSLQSLVARKLQMCTGTTGPKISSTADCQWILAVRPAHL